MTGAQDRDYVRGPYPRPEGVEEVSTQCCWGCANPLRPKQVRIRIGGKHPVCNDCYLRSDYQTSTCTVCGAVKKRIRAGEAEYVCARHGKDFV